MVVGFNVRSTPRVIQYAKDISVSLFTSKVIFSIFDQIQASLSALLPPQHNIIVAGVATVTTLFKLRMSRSAISALHTQLQDALGTVKVDMDDTCYVAGSRITEGIIHHSSSYRWRIVRDNNPIATDLYAVQIRVFKDVVQHVDKGQECGILLNHSKSIQPGDLLQCYQVKDVHPTYDDSIARGYNPETKSPTNLNSLKYNHRYELVPASKFKVATVN
uniref:Translation initiation factor IF-2 n=1 Tax=Lygus hesperus TaxID=30085 RepID=A0A0A9VXJ6_LYGHE